MKVSDGRINYLSRHIARALMTDQLVEGADLDTLAKEVKRGFVFFFQREETIDKKVRGKIASLKRGVPEGSAEWDVLYRQYYNEEIDKM